MCLEIIGYVSRVVFDFLKVRNEEKVLVLKIILWFFVYMIVIIG